MSNSVIYSVIVPLYNEELVIDESYLTFFIGIISMVVTITKNMFNKTKLIYFGMMILINMMMFGVTLGCIGIMGQYIGRILAKPIAPNTSPL